MNKIQYILAILIIIVVCTSIIYSNHFNNEFHFDDSHTIQNNVYIRGINNIPLFFKDARTFSNLPQNQSYRPVVSTTLALDYWFGNGYNLFYFHFFSFLLFLIQGILMFFFLMKIFQGSATANGNNYSPIYYATAFAIGWYMFHPANAETINYIIARSDLQSTFFVVLAFVLYIYSPLSRKTFLYLFPVVIGTLAKPTAIMFAPLLLFYIILFEEKTSLLNLFKKTHLNQLAFIIKKTLPAFILCAAMYIFVDKMTPPTWVSGGSSVIAYLITQPFVISHYFGIFFIPAGLSADTDWGLLPGIWNIRFFTGLAFIAIMLYAAFYCSSKEKLRPISFGILWFFISLIPTSSVIPFSEVLNYHRVFFPFIGLTISVSWIIYLLVDKYRVLLMNNAFQYGLATVLICFLACYAYNTYQRNKVWRTEETLWYDVTIKSPNNGRGLMNYGLVKMAKGDYIMAQKYFTEALKILPYYSALYVNIGILENAMGDQISAESYFKRGLEYGNNYPDTWFFYARFLCQWHRYKEAVPLLIKAINLSPAYINARLLLMNAYNETAQWDELNLLTQETKTIDPSNPEIVSYQQAARNRKTKMEVIMEDIRQSPTAEKFLNLSLLYYEAGNYQQCIIAATKAIKFKPDYAEAYNNMASAYNQLHEYNNAVTMCRKALTFKNDFLLASNNLINATNNLNQIKRAEMVVEQKPTADNYLNLSVVYYNLGMYRKCIETCNKALTLKQDFDLAYNNICSSYNRLEEWDQAIAAGERGLKINSANTLIQNNLRESRQRKLALKSVN